MIGFISTGLNAFDRAGVPSTKVEDSKLACEDGALKRDKGYHTLALLVARSKRMYVQRMAIARDLSYRMVNLQAICRSNSEIKHKKT